MIVGIDPAQRNVGLCFRDKGVQPVFRIIQPDSDILASGLEIRETLQEFFKQFRPTTFVIEKQMPNATRTGPLLFYIQMMVLEAIRLYNPDPQLVWPLPVQLRSYLHHKVGADIKSKGSVVAHFKKTEAFEGRISSHCVEAFYLTRLAEEVLAKTWVYNLSEKELPIVSWKVINGK